MPSKINIVNSANYGIDNTLLKPKLIFFTYIDDFFQVKLNISTVCQILLANQSPTSLVL